MDRRHRSVWQAAAFAAALAVTLGGGASYAQDSGGSPDVYPLYPKAGTAPLTNGPPETSEGGRIRNVTQPTLTVFRPAPGVASDVAIIIAPGGGFEHLSIANEGFAVAQRLAEAGVTAIVLKYRLNPRAPRPRPLPGQPVSPPRSPPSAHDVNRSPGALMAMADGDAAIRFVRAHAQELKINPSRVGVLGFSAGGVVALHVATSPDLQTRPDFAASIYGPAPEAATAPPDAPPLFLAVAGDDKLVGPAGILPVYELWRGAGRDVELHAYDSGGHGFGMTHQDTTSDHWIDAYIWWLRAHKLLGAAAIK
jgi:acetyl esterase/lipase